MGVVTHEAIELSISDQTATAPPLSPRAAAMAKKRAEQKLLQVAWDAQLAEKRRAQEAAAAREAAAVAADEARVLRQQREIAESFAAEQERERAAAAEKARAASVQATPALELSAPEAETHGSSTRRAVGCRCAIM